MWHLFIENIPLNIRKQHEACQVMPIGIGVREGILLGGADKICPKNKKLPMKPTFLVQSELGLKLVNLFYIVEFVYKRFVCNVNSLITLHFVRSRWHLLHAFQFVYNFNSAITFLI